jgi:hypothetical protein
MKIMEDLQMKRNETVSHRRGSSRAVWATGLALTCVIFTGCNAWKQSSLSWLPWNRTKVSESPYQQPVRMAVIWTETSLNPPNKPPVRGFGGRIFFFNNRNQPIPVDGQLVVYAYDETDVEHPKREPDRRYVFTPEQFTEQYRETALGASYNVWLPWDAVGNPQRSITLMPVFTSVNGNKIIDQNLFSKHVLPGPGSDTRVKVDRHRDMPLYQELQQAAYSGEMASQVQPASAEMATAPRKPATRTTTRAKPKTSTTTRRKTSG